MVYLESLLRSWGILKYHGVHGAKGCPINGLDLYDTIEVNQGVSESHLLEGL